MKKMSIMCLFAFQKRSKTVFASFVFFDVPKKVGVLLRGNAAKMEQHPCAYIAVPVAAIGRRRHFA